MTKNRKGSHYSHPTSKSKGKTYLSDIQLFGNETTDEENPHAGNKAGTPKECLVEALTMLKMGVSNDNKKEVQDER